MPSNYKIIFYVSGLFLAGCISPVFAQEHNANIFKIGGQARVRGDFVKNQDLGAFSLNPDTRDEQFLSRTRSNLSIEPAEQIKGFVQGQFYDRLNKREDYSKANLYQAYIELSEKGFPLSLKAGRQEFSYGSAFFLGANDFYEGLVWDGVKINISAHDDLWVDLIGARYVKLSKNTSDDEPALYGAYSGYKLATDMDLEAYFFYHKGGFKFFHDDLPGDDKWFTLGTRMAGKVGERVDYEIEPMYQFGRIDNPDRGERDLISAYGGHIESGYTFKSEHNPRVFAGYAFGSGDNDTSDKKFREFHGNVYNDNYLVGDTSIIPDTSGLTVGDFRASGMNVLIAGFSFDINLQLNLNLDYHYFYADKTPEEVSKKLGSEVNLIASYKLGENLNIMLGANRFYTGRFFEDTAGSKKDLTYSYAQAQIEF